MQRSKTGKMLRAAKEIVSWRARSRGFLVLISFVFAVSVIPHAAAKKGPAVWQDAATGYAVGGYDPIAYFTRGLAIEGRYGMEITWRGAVWKFQNEGNRLAFERDPAVYAPRFAGHDPYSLAKDRIVQGLPTLWRIHENKLYFFQNVINMRYWTEDPKGILSLAVARWPKMARKLPWK